MQTTLTLTSSAPELTALTNPNAGVAAAPGNPGFAGGPGDPNAYPGAGGPTPYNGPGGNFPSQPGTTNGAAVPVRLKYTETSVLLI